MVNFIFSLHNHQPAGNFPTVLEKAYRESYRPFLDILKDFPSIKVSLHTTGFLLDFLEENHPEYIKDLASLVGDGQVEIMGGGYFEPVLAVIPDGDRLGQISMLSDRVEKLFGLRPRGMWLAERVWEPTLPSTLYDAGMEYVVVDDHHFRRSGIEGPSLNGYYVTENLGKPIKVFPGSEALRYMIPFGDVGSFRGFFDGVAGGASATGGKETPAGTPTIVYADDGEKFGLWPKTYDHVFKNGWLRRFFTELSSLGDIVTTATYSEVIDTTGSLGRVYLPTTSYMEMGEWALPPQAASDFSDTVERLKSMGDVDSILGVLQGGTWRNFFSKYKEADWMHKRMLQVSKVLENPSVTLSDEAYGEARRLLYRAQSNDSYWHGVFGGLYLPHLRCDVYYSLIRAEAIALGNVGSGGTERAPTVEEVDVDGDTLRDILLRNGGINLFIKPSLGGGIVELDYIEKGINLQNTLTRYREGYHNKFIDSLKEAGRHQDHEGHGHGNGDEGVEGPKSIHDASVVDRDLIEGMKVDGDVRRSLRESIYRFVPDSEEAISERAVDFGSTAFDCRLVEGGEAMCGVALSASTTIDGEGGARGVDLKKVVTLSYGSYFEVDYTLKVGPGGRELLYLGIELNTLLPACDGPATRLIVNPSALGSGGLGPHGPEERVTGFGTAVHYEELSGFVLEDEYKGVRVTVTLDSDFSLVSYPIETVSLSEAGPEKIFQGLSTTLLVPIPESVSYEGGTGKVSLVYSLGETG